MAGMTPHAKGQVKRELTTSAIWYKIGYARAINLPANPGPWIEAVEEDERFKHLLEEFPRTELIIIFEDC